MAERNMEVYEAKLQDPNLDIKAKCTFATELRDSIEAWCQGTNYALFIAKFMPIFMETLMRGQPVFISTSPEQASRLRSCILEILNRLPMSPSEVTEPYAVQVVDLCMHLVRMENEENAVLCMKIVMDFERHHTKVLADRVQPFLDLIQEMFESMEQTVKDTFDGPVPGVTQGIPSTPSNSQYSHSPRPGSPVAATSDLGGDQQQATSLLKGMHSFKVLAECPIIVVSLFQAYRNSVPKNVKAFVPRIKTVLMLQAKPQEKAHQDAKAQGRIFAGVSKDIKNRAAFGEFITAQVKTMSFLAYLLRVYAQQLTDFLPALPDIVVRLLQDCPREKSGARKELLVAIRHIINYNFRKIFLPKIDELLDERTLIGDGLTVYETLRPLAYSMLADLIHHVRDSLSKEQIRRTVEVYTKNLHDDYPGTSFQTMSAKLLLNMAECIARLPDKQDGRHFLVMILNAIGDKFAAMNRQYHNAVKVSKQYSQQSIDAVPENYMADKDQPPDWDNIDIYTATPIKTSNPRERGSDPVADNKFLFKNLLHGLKNLFYQLRICNPPQTQNEIAPDNAPPNWHEVSLGYNAEEIEVLIKLLREGAQVFRYYNTEPPSVETQHMSPAEFLANHQMANSGKEEKDLLESFATVFHHIDPAAFHEVFHSEIPNLYNMMFDNAALLHVPQFLLASEATSPSFAGMLLQFLMEKLDEVGTSDVKKSSILLRLFKLSFMAVTLFCAQNEQVLLPHVTKLITKSIQLSVTAEEPMNYFLLLRSLFRSIGGGRFEHLYKELLPLLEMLLEVLNNLLVSARKPHERDLFVELSLTVPARLSNLLPHLDYLMRPLVVALRAGSELIAQGLRTLELCVDNLTADYLDPIMAPVIDELMAALWDHLRPNPYSHFHAHTTMRILGKLGGRNRKFLSRPPELEYKPYADDESSIDIRVVGSAKERPFPARLGIDLAMSKLMEVPKAPAAKKSDGFHKQQALKLISTQIKLIIGSDNLPDDFAQLVRLQANDLADREFTVGTDLMTVSEREKSIPKKDADQESLKKLLKACMFAASLPDTKASASALLQDVYRHFTILEVGRALAYEKHRKKDFDVKAGEGPVCIDSSILADAMIETLSSDNAAVRDVAIEAVTAIRDAAVVVFGASDRIDKLPFFSHLAKTFSHSCHEEDWFVKAGGTLGIDVMANKIDMGDEWMILHQIDFIRALMYVMKDVPQDLPANTRIQAQYTLEILLRRCHSKVSKEDIKNPQTKLYNLCGYLVFELAHQNRHVREAAQKSFRIIGEVVGAEVHELLIPVKERLLGPIFMKPLRALPFAVQIGYIDAVTYCLKLHHGVLEFHEQLNRLLMESLALADSDEETLVAKPHDQRNAESIVNLKVACLGLLCTAIGFTEFGASPQQAQSRTRIIAVFFRCLYSKSPDIAQTANAGLKVVLGTTNKLPKDLLQNGLRPILMNLQDPRKLNVEGLEGLATLLQLLTNYFKVEIGQRLLDHMRTIADPISLQKISFTLIEQNKQMKIVTAIFNVFHLLPPAAIQFLKELVERVIELEVALRRTHNSPFREPLVKYLNHYPKEAWNFFRPQIKNEVFGRFFAQILAYPASGPLREAVAGDVSGFLETLTKEGSEEERWPAVINAIHVAQSLCKFPETRSWLAPHESLKEALFNSAKELQIKLRDNSIEPGLRLAVEQAGERVMEVFTTYMAHQREDLDFFFEIVEAVTKEELKSCPPLFDFITCHMVSNNSVDYWRTLVLRCIDLYTGRHTPQKTKTFAFHYVVNPIFATDIMRNWDSLFGSSKGTELMDKSMTEVINNRLWKPQSVGDISDEPGQSGVDHSRMELLQMTTMLVKYHHNLIQETRKDIIKFGWNFIKLEDVINKLAAYVLIAYFIAQYDTPAKIAVQVYTALLKAHQNEGRSLVTLSLEVLAPVLRRRIGVTDPKPALLPKIPRKILTEEGSNLQQLTSIFHFLVRHPDLFYEARRDLAPIIIQSLGKIAQLPNPSNENKKLAVNLMTLVWLWEKKAVDDAGSLPGPQSPGSVHSPTATKVAPLANHTSRLNLLKYLANFIATLTERFPTPSAKIKEVGQSHVLQPAQSTDMIKKSLQLLHNLLSPPYWNDVDIEGLFPKVTEPVLLNDPKQDERVEVWVTRAVNTLQILRVLVNVKPNEWVVARLPQLQKLLDKPLRSENSEIQDCLHNPDSESQSTDDLKPLLARILEAVPDETLEEDLPNSDNPTSEFVSSLSAIATEGLSQSNHVSSINILWTLSKHRSKELDQHIGHVMRALQTKLSKDHLAFQMTAQQALQQPTRSGDGPPTGIPDPHEAEMAIELTVKAIELLATQIVQLGEQRRPYLSVLATLVERSQSNVICLKILNMVEAWVFNSTETVPTLKEKTAVLGKMASFENRADKTLFTKFLNLVIRVYEDPKITRSELTVRLEHAFLIGTRAQDIDMRNRFMTIFDRSLKRPMSNRMNYTIISQNWDTLSETFWLSQVIELLFGSVVMDNPIQLHIEDNRCLSASQLFKTYANDQRASGLMLDDEFESFIANEKRFCSQLSEVKVRDVFEPLCNLQHTDSNLAHEIWVAFFPLCWSILSKDDRADLENGMVNLLTKDFHQRQIDKRPNCAKTLLEGITRTRPRFRFPPQVMKFVARTYDAWYIAACTLEETAISPIIDRPAVRESNLDALVEIYANLQEEDLFYGTWRRRCQFIETNAALSYEQNGMWDKAQSMYEAAQIKARTGALPFSQGEYMLWEDHWVLCAQKLQQWEILGDFAKHENFNDLFLESTWRNFEAWTGNENREQLDSIIKAVSDASTPRRSFFQAFMSLLKLHGSLQSSNQPLKAECQQEFNRICDENIQLSIRKWHQLPKRITNAHIPILQNFQQLVELHDASVICGSLAVTTAANLDMKSQELKLLLGTWRDRLPNFWDDINAWQDLVTWRQHIFQLINGTYLNLLPPQQGNTTGNSFAYRGYHETAWIINRFAHVARKHQMPEVCINQLSRIYTLPNIEIQEAFLKLREQAKCHYQNHTELTSGLDVINNTNLNYFGQQQKAEFYTLKGMFLAKLNHKDEANDAFGSALYFDIKLPKAWSEWGHYNDMLFKEDPSNIDKPASAISCYLEAAGQFKNAKSRKLLSRILWLLSLDNSEGRLAQAFEDFKGETPVWYWITFIPQLLNNLSRSQAEANIAKQILAKLAKTYPQALYFQLRTIREDMAQIKKQQEMKEQREKAMRAKQAAEANKQSSPTSRSVSSNGTAKPNGDSSQNGTLNNASATPKTESTEQTVLAVQAADPSTPKKPWEFTEEIMAMLKTAFPLLALSMETMVDQIHKHFKCPPDEDAYRLIVALLNDGLSYIGRLPTSYAQDVKLPASTEANITRFAESILPPHIRRSFEADFVTKKPTMFEYIQKLRKWRDRFEERLDHRSLVWNLETHSPHLSEFRFQKFDEVEVPGQYLQHRDKNQDFVRIERFLPTVNLVRGVGYSHRRIKIRGHDGSIHPFAIQHPAARHSRREERVLQLFRTFNVTLAKRKESRRRNLSFHLPAMIPLSPHLRMVQDDASYISLQQIYEDYCRRNGINKDDPVLYTMDKLRALNPQKPEQAANIRLETFHAIQEKYVPPHVVLDYFRATYPSFADFWLFRRQFSYQLAALTFMTYTMHMNTRYPQKMSIARATGNIWGSELIPAMAAGKPYFHNPEPVPFRLTPNLQTLMGPIHTEGIFACAVMAIARCLTEPEHELDTQLSIFIRDEMTFWYTQQHRQNVQDGALRDSVGANSELIVKRAVSLGKEPSGSNLPANQTVIDLVALAVSPTKLSQCDPLWMAWL